MTPEELAMRVEEGEGYKIEIRFDEEQKTEKRFDASKSER